MEELYFELNRLVHNIQPQIEDKAYENVISLIDTYYMPKEKALQAKHEEELKQVLNEAMPSIRDMFDAASLNYPKEDRNAFIEGAKWCRITAKQIHNETFKKDYE